MRYPLHSVIIWSIHAVSEVYFEGWESFVKWTNVGEEYGQNEESFSGNLTYLREEKDNR